MRRTRRARPSSETNSLHRSTSLLTDFVQCSEIDLSLLGRIEWNGTNIHLEALTICGWQAVGEHSRYLNCAARVSYKPLPDLSTGIG